jgi:5-methylcytosine-specific restriction endonuclease McrA
MNYPNHRFLNLKAAPMLPREMRVARLPQHEWQALKALVHAKSGGACFYCGVDASRYPICDHLVPICRGGTNDLSNLVTACDACNSSKGSLTPDEWRIKRELG